MTGTQLEDAAKALYAVAPHLMAATDRMGGAPIPWSETSHKTRLAYYDMVRAVLLAIRVPHGDILGEGQRFDPIERSYTSMIDFILGEQPD